MTFYHQGDETILCSTCTYLNRVVAATTDPVLLRRVSVERARHLEDARKGLA